MRSTLTILRLIGQVIIALFAVNSLVSYIRPQYSDLSIIDGSTRDSFNSSERRLSTTQPGGAAYTTTSYTSADGETSHYILQRPYPPNQPIPSQSVLFLTITRDGDSWGRNPTEPPRTIHSYLDLITNTTLAPSAVSVALLTSSPSEFERYKQILTPPLATSDPEPEPGHAPGHNATFFDYPFHRVTIVLHTAATRAPLPSHGSNDNDKDSSKAWNGGSRENRHGIAQHERRAVLAKLRNYLQFVSLADESHLLWLDSDVYRFSDRSMVSTMMEFTTTTERREVGVLTARCRVGEPERAVRWMREHPDFVVPDEARDGEEEPEGRGREGGRYEVIAWGTNSNGNYDLNAWRGRRTGPNNIEQEMLWKDLTSWEPHPASEEQTQGLDGVLENTKNDDVRMLDSVGGTVLMIRSDFVRMGLNFATGYLVGMTFEHGEGYDGIETEGICLLSRSMSRDGQSLCHTIGGDWSVWHTIY